MKRLEFLALAIARENMVLEPGTEACATLNPGMLRSHSLDRLNVVNDQGTRIFSTFQGGYRALINNLEAKCSGKTRANGKQGRLSPESTLDDLIRSFRYISTEKIVEFLKEALDDKFIKASTPLQFFLTD